MAQLQQEHELGELRNGYPALATWTARDPDNETFVFRKFDRLAARNLLHLQCQIIAVEEEIDQLDADVRKDPDTQNSSMRWETLMRNARTENRLEHKLVQKLADLHSLLKEYHETLLRQAKIGQLKPPNKRILGALRHYIKGDGHPQQMQLIFGAAQSYLEEQDLAALCPPPDEDYLSRFLQDHWTFQKRCGKDPFDGTTFYQRNDVVNVVAAISMLIVSLLLISAIVLLHVISNAQAKLGIVAAFTLVFALCVALLTNARRTEVFAATAAYAAVLVVFVSGELGGGRTDQCFINMANGLYKSVRCPG